LHLLALQSKELRNKHKNIQLKLITLSIFVSFLSCNSETRKKTDSKNADIQVTDPDSKSYHSTLVAREEKYSDKNYDSLGKLINTINFEVKTSKKDSTVPWANIEAPEKDIDQLINGNEMVIQENKVTIIIDYPLNNPYKYIISSTDGFTRTQLLKKISELYHSIYSEEEKTSTIKTIPPDKRVGIYNRNETNGKYGIWGHDIGDLDLSSISVYKTSNDVILLVLDIES
jgi:hypothetical protein